MYTSEELRSLAHSSVNPSDHLYFDRGNKVKYSETPLGSRFSKNLYFRELEKLVKTQKAEHDLLDYISYSDSVIDLKSLDMKLSDHLRSRCKSKGYDYISEYILNKSGVIRSNSLWNKCCYLVNLANNHNYRLPKYKVASVNNEFDELKKRFFDYRNITQNFLFKLRKVCECNGRFSIYYIFKYYLDIPFELKTPKIILKFIRIYLKIGKLYMNEQSIHSLIQDIKDSTFSSFPSLSVKKMKPITSTDHILTVELLLTDNSDESRFTNTEALLFQYYLNILLREPRLNTQNFLEKSEIWDISINTNRTGFLIHILTKDNISSIMYTLVRSIIDSLSVINNSELEDDSPYKDFNPQELKILRETIQENPEWLDIMEWSLSYEDPNNLETDNNKEEE